MITINERPNWVGGPGSKQIMITHAEADSDTETGRLLARVEDLRLHFDTDRGNVEALDGVNFELYSGEIFALVGETGCGKSITARSFMQLVPSPPGYYPGGRVMMRTRERCAECGGNGCDACESTGQSFEDLIQVCGQIGRAHV